MSNDVLRRRANPAPDNGEQQHPVPEMADLWCHTLVLLARQALAPAAALQELDQRFGISGHGEQTSG